MGKDCCRCARLSAIYCITLIVQAIVIIHAIAFLLLCYLRGTKIYFAMCDDDLKYVLHFDCLIPLAIVQLLWLISAIGTIYSMQKIIPCLMLPHLFTSSFLLFATILIITSATYHIIKGLRLNNSLILLLLLPCAYSFGALYSIYLTLSCFRLLMRKRKTVISVAKDDTHQKEVLKTEEVLSSMSNSISYSRQSTAIITDNHHHCFNDSCKF